MAPKTISEWREDPDAEPKVDRKAIERHVDRILKDQTDVDIETFIIIETCKSWYEEYKRILTNKRKEISSASRTTCNSPAADSLTHEEFPSADDYQEAPFPSLRQLFIADEQPREVDDSVVAYLEAKPLMKEVMNLLDDLEQKTAREADDWPDALQDEDDPGEPPL